MSALLHSKSDKLHWNPPAACHAIPRCQVGKEVSVASRLNMKTVGPDKIPVELLKTGAMA